MLRGTGILRQRLRVTCAASAFTESHIIRGMVWLSSYKQVNAKVCAAWKLYEHSNGFRAKNF